MSSVTVARPLLFVRALARVSTAHRSVETKHGRWASLARAMGELVSLLALAVLSEVEGADRPYQVLLGIVAAFLVPTVLLDDRSLDAARRALFGADSGAGAHAAAGALGVLLCFGAYEGVLVLLDRCFGEFSSGVGRGSWQPPA